MADSTPTGGSPDPFADTPLFREIQRILQSGGGPVNWELARQVGIASARGGGEAPIGEDEAARLEGAVRMAEIAIADLTGLPGEVLRVRAVDRGDWVRANADGLRDLFEAPAARVSALLADARRGEQDLPLEGGPMLEAMLGQLSPLLMGAQVGTVLGRLAQDVLTQYELPLPRAGAPELLFVAPNIETFERDWSLPREELRGYLAMHETAHALTLGRPWVRPHLVALVREVAEGMEFDLAALESRLRDLDSPDPTALAEALGDPSELFGGEMTDERRLLLRRVQAFLAAAEGYADHVTDIAARDRLPSFGRIHEAVRRRHEGRPEEERMVERLLGLDVVPEHYRLGRTFCDRVAEVTDEPTLARMWGSTDSMPSMPELEEPTLWLARMA